MRDEGGLSSPVIAAFGEALWDLLPGGPVLGGAPLNFVYRCSALGVRSVLVSRLGTDDLGRRAESRMRELGIDSSRIQWDPVRPTGTVEVAVDARGNPDFRILPDVAYDYIEPDPDTSAMAGCSCLCFGTLAQRSPVSRSTLEGLLDAFRGRFRLLDVNLRRDCYSVESIRSSVRRANVVKMNETEVPEVAGACGLRGGSIPEVAGGLIREEGLDYCVVTMGERGCHAASRAGEQVYEPAFRVSLVDTCGSGDAFAAAFICSLLRGEALGAACRAGNALGAIVAGQAGATAPVSPHELERFLAAGADADAEKGG